MTISRSFAHIRQSLRNVRRPPLDVARRLGFARALRWPAQSRLWRSFKSD